VEWGDTWAGDVVVVVDVLCALGERARGEVCMKGAIGEARM
jgi:hypothetical protein